MATRYVRDAEAFAQALNAANRGSRDAQRPTGTEIRQTADTADQAGVDAAAAIAAASAAETLAKGAVTFSASPPTVGDADGKPLGALWTVVTASAISSYWELTSFGWVQRPLSTTVIPQINIGTGTFGVLAGTRLAADAIDGMTITAPLIRTAESGQRMEFNPVGLQAFDETGVLTSSLLASGGSFLMRGRLPAGFSTPQNVMFRLFNGETVFRGEAAYPVGDALAFGRFSLASSPDPASGVTLNMQAPRPTPSSGAVVTASIRANHLASGVDPRRFTISTNADEAEFAAQKIFLNGAVRVPGDREWARINVGSPIIATLGAGFTHDTDPFYDGLNARVKGGVLYITGRVLRATFPANAVLFTLNPAFRPGRAMVQYAYTGAHNFAVAQPNGDCIIATAGTQGATVGFSWPLE